MTTLDFLRGSGSDYHTNQASALSKPDINMSFLTNVLNEQDTLTRGREPEWLIPTLQRFLQIVSLQNNWDQNGARQVDQSLVLRAIQVLLQLMYSNTPVPSVVPTPDGCIQVEWHTKEIDLEVEFLGPAHFYVFFDDMQDGIEWDGELTYDLTRLAAFIETLSYR